MPVRQVLVAFRGWSDGMSKWAYYAVHDNNLDHAARVLELLREGYCMYNVIATNECVHYILKKGDSYDETGRS